MSSTAVTSTSGAAIDQVQPLLEALKAIGATLKAEGVPFALAGSYAVYARGGARSLHDVDFVVPLDAIPAATDALEQRGFRVEQPPEDWLVKVYRDDLFIDVIHCLSSGDVTPELLSRADELPVESVLMPVLSATDLLLGKLMALSEHSCDLEPVLAVARSLREQIDVAHVRERCAGHPYAEAGLFLIRRLAILPDLGDPDAAEPVITIGTGTTGTAGAGVEEPDPEPTGYRLKEVERLLAEDDGTSELQIQLGMAGGRLVVQGRVASAERRERVLATVREHCPGVVVVDELGTDDDTLARAPETSEGIS